jgi:cytochrome c biogenesis protein CcdA
LRAADAAITRRFATISLGVVLLAGLLDGVNPCAFATIVFLLSWLRVAKRSPREIAQIGAAYCAGVFLAYFVLGLGLVEVITRLALLRWAGQTLNWLMAAFTLVLTGLSVRDGVLCLRGQMTEMTLQLPDALKLRIHGIIRTGARHRRFVMMAFGIGVAIAFLELACTGQVYAPTLLFMAKSGSLLAVGYLLLYNLAFITPLLVVFLLACGGMQSESFTRFLQRRAALVKFATALLFGLMFLLLVFGQRLLS